MAEITKELGRIPVSRGDYQATVEYYKDNIVQYKRGSYQVVSESPIVGVPPTNDKNIVNPGWTLFAGTLDAQDVVNQIKEQETKSIQAVADREAEILAKSDAAKVSFNNTGTSLSGTNVQDALKETDGKLSELEDEMLAVNIIKKEESLYSLIGGKYIRPDGHVGQYAPMSISNVVELKKGDVLIAKFKSTKESAAIGKTDKKDGTSSTFEVVVQGIDTSDITEYKYRATEEIEYVQMSYYTDFDISCAIYSQPDFYELKKDIKSLAYKTEVINISTGTTLNTLQPSYVNGKYIKANGNESSYNPMSLSEKITLSKNQVVVVDCYAYNDISVISKTTNTEGIYIPLVLGDSEDWTHKLFKWVADEECNIVVSVLTDKPHYVYLVDSKELIELKGVADSLHAEVVNINKKITNETNTEIQVVSIEGKYVKPNGQIGAYAPMSYSEIKLNAGETLVAKMASTVEACAVAEKKPNGYTTLILGNDDSWSSPIEYTYTTDHDAVICISYRTEFDAKVIIKKSTDISELFNFFERNKKKKEIHVGLGIGYDYDNLQDAIDAILDDTPENRYTIYVHPGIYQRFSQSDNNRRVHYVSIIGIDRVACKVVSNTGNYYEPPFECLMDGTVENMSFIMESDEEHYNPQIDKDDRYSYAMHSDYDFPRTTLFRNCYFESNTGPAIGLGTHQDVSLLFEGCEFVRKPFRGDDLGAVFAHTMPDGRLRQVVKFISCICNNLVGAPGIYFSRVGNTVDTDYNYICQNCGSFGIQGANALLKSIVIGRTSYGNNCDNLNA